MTTSPQTQRHPRRLAFLYHGLLAGYWALLFTLTHVPVDKLPMPRVSDKVLHLGAYGLLGLLLGLAWRPPPGRRWTIHFLCLGLVLASYGVLDELLQIPVGRNAELLDWVSDVVGSSAGLLACAGWLHLSRRAR